MPETVKQTIRKALSEAEAAARTAHARQSPRCHHIRENGVRCGSPAMRGQPYCYVHDRMMNRMPTPQFPPLEDGNAVQCAIMQVLEGLASGSIEIKMANAMLYALQTAAANLRRVNFEPLHPITQFPMDRPAPAQSEAKPMAVVTEIKAMAAV